jgi:hypothetical protein
MESWRFAGRHEAPTLHHKACTPHGVRITAVALLTRAGHRAIEYGEEVDSTVVVSEVGHLALG